MKKLVNLVVILCGTSIFSGVIILCGALLLNEGCSKPMPTNPVVTSSAIKAQDTGCTNPCGTPVPCGCTYSSNFPCNLLFCNNTATFTFTPTITQTQSITPTSTGTQTITPSITQTPNTPTTTPSTNTPTATASPETPTPTPTSNTPTSTPTFTPSPTFTPMPTDTPTPDVCQTCHTNYQNTLITIGRDALNDFLNSTDEMACNDSCSGAIGPLFAFCVGGCEAALDLAAKVQEAAEFYEAMDTLADCLDDNGCTTELLN